MKKLYIGSLLILAISFKSYATPYFALLPKIQFEHGVYNSYLVGTSVIDYIGSDIVDIPAVYHEPYVLLGCSYNERRPHLVTQAGYEGFVLYLGGRMTLINYTNFTGSANYLRLEIGLTLFGLATVTYGYSVELSRKELESFKGHSISINIAYYFSKE
jgi:hypothetical protein